MTIAITGANGFVGRSLSAHVERHGHKVRRLVRRQTTSNELAVGDLAAAPVDLNAALQGVSTVIHLAARAHIMNETSANPLEVFRASNVLGTRRLAEAACAAGVKRMVFVSTIKVHGETTQIGRPFRSSDPLSPGDAYAESKAEAEAMLASFARDLEIAIVRPPLVYGPGVKANFQMLSESIRRGVPLPLGRIVNERSLIGIDNLCALLIAVASHSDAASRAFLVADGAPVSTPQLVASIARAMGKSARLLPVPVAALRLAAGLLRRGAIVERLCNSLAVDIDDTCRVLNWQPEFSLEEGLGAMLEADSAE